MKLNDALRWPARMATGNENKPNTLSATLSYLLALACYLATLLTAMVL